jgi:hypothetical protein
VANNTGLHLERLHLHSCIGSVVNNMQLVMQSLVLRCPNLTDVNLAEASFDALSTMAWFTVLVTGCPRLTALDVSKIEAFDDACMHIIAQQCPRLTKLEAAHTHISGKGVAAVAEACTELRIVNCEAPTKCPAHINDACLLPLIRRFSRLERLGLGSTDITDETMRAIAQCQPRLQSLTVSNTLITNVGVIAVARGCPHLEELSLACCRRLSARAVTVGVARYSRALTTLHLAETPSRGPWPGCGPTTPASTRGNGYSRSPSASSSCRLLGTRWRGNGQRGAAHAAGHEGR